MNRRTYALGFFSLVVGVFVIGAVNGDQGKTAEEKKGSVKSNKVVNATTILYENPDKLVVRFDIAGIGYDRIEPREIKHPDGILTFTPVAGLIEKIESQEKSRTIVIAIYKRGTSLSLKEKLILRPGAIIDLKGSIIIGNSLEDPIISAPVAFRDPCVLMNSDPVDPRP